MNRRTRIFCHAYHEFVELTAQILSKGNKMTLWHQASFHLWSYWHGRNVLNRLLMSLQGEIRDFSGGCTNLLLYLANFFHAKCMKMKKIGARILLCRSATGLSLFICKFAMCSFKSKNCRFPVPISIPPLHPRSTRFKGSLLIMQKSVTGSVVHHINLILLHG